MDTTFESICDSWTKGSILTQDFESSASEQLEYSVFGNDVILIDNPAIDY
jgi:hypothetical protein